METRPFSFPLLLIFLLRFVHGNTPPVPVPVGVVLDMGSVVGRTGMTGLQMAVEDFYLVNPNYTTRIHLLPRDDAQRDIVSATSAVISLLKTDGAQAIIGPQVSSAAEFIAEIANVTGVPVLSFSATSPLLSTRNTPFFIRTAVDDSLQAAPIAAIFRAFNWKQAVTIYEDNEFGAAPMPALIDALRKVDCVVPYRSVIPSAASDDLLKEELYKLQTMQTRVFIVHMVRQLGTRLLAFAEKLGMMDRGYAWIVTDEITSMVGVTDSPSALQFMQGAIGLKPYVPPSPKLDQFKARWRRRYRGNASADPLEAAPSQFVLWAYDTATALAIAVERARLSNPVPLPHSNNSPHDLFHLGVSPTGQRLLDAISSVEFDGLSGRFKLVDGQIQCEAFEIVTMTGQTERTIGFWSKRNGLKTTMDGRGDSKGEALLPVIWPGETVTVPKGWAEPVSGRRMRIAVPGPADPGFHALLRMDWDQKTNTSKVGGFVIDVFEEAVKQLPYAVLWDYVPFQTKHGKSSGDYNDLIRNVSAGVYDGVVGDVTITMGRAQYVDFTMPYTTSGVSMVVPNRDYRSTNAWIFLRPLTPKLWAVTFTFFVGTGAVVWLLEHRVNEDFRRGGPTEQLGSVFYFTFSTVVFAHRERMESNLSKFVLVVWLFVVLILTSSYTASLTSMLTVQQLRPTVADISDLIKTNQRVGYLKNSFVKYKLLEMNFKEENLVPVKSPQQYAEMLDRGSDQGGVAAVIDETPYLKLFLKDFCINYTMTGQQLKTGGFGFAFPKGSPFVGDLSRAILNIAEGETLVKIERKWLGDPSSCADQGSPVSSATLGFMSFWGLFAITGSVSISVLALVVARFLYEKRGIFRSDVHDGGASFGRKVLSLIREFDHKDPRARDAGDLRLEGPTCTPRGSAIPLSFFAAGVGGGSATTTPSEGYGTMPSTPGTLPERAIVNSDGEVVVTLATDVGTGEGGRNGANVP